MVAHPLEDVPERFEFPEEEEKVLKYWTDIKAFETALKLSEGKPEYTFYDGPPFATGLPHYGHILAGTIKDIVTRYAHQTGHHVSRRFGWDCHGLPVEYEIDQKLGIKGRDDVMAMGIDKYNAECRAIVMRYSKEWEIIVKRLGRWIDFENDYKTLNPSFMESVWWVFKTLFEKSLVYRGFKVMPYSTKCNTPLSNFEANLNYKDASDPEVVVTFPLVEDPNVNVIAWTTTPWTLPSNLALCVNPDQTYVKIEDPESKRIYILMEARLKQLYKDPAKAKFKTLAKYKGSELAGKQYTPLFTYFEKEYKGRAFKICADSYVTDDSGTGVVHMAPGFGEDDYRVCVANGVIKKGDAVLCPIDANAFFLPTVKDFAGQQVKEADKAIIAHLKDRKRVVKSGTIVHSYPFCWRSETPLIYKAVPSWFVKVEDIKTKLMANNDKTYWVPDFVKEKRFHNWLRDARDWSVSRNRYWGTPIPIWTNETFTEIVVIGSIKELEEKTGEKITDIHRDKIDHLKIKSKDGKSYLKRVDEVFDCWFESGSMPYGQVHYPFENKAKFEQNFPADFIAEGLDQTRGWFYTLMVISTALFDKPAFKNLIVNGLVLAEDGKKMSKRLKNYPDPMEVVNKHSADALRLYLINSPVVRAEPLKFKGQGVKDIVKDVFLPWYNAYRFFVQNARRYEQDTGKTFMFDAKVLAKNENVMDRWIQASLQSLIEYFHTEMKAYRLYTVVPHLLHFLNDVTNWYVRLNRLRLKGSGGAEDCKQALTTLFDVLLNLAKTMAPFTPFLCESMYLNLRQCLPEKDRCDSVHFTLFPQPNAALADKNIERAVSNMQNAIEIGRTIREHNTLSLKQPLKNFFVVHEAQETLKDVQQLERYVKEELNVHTVTYDSKVESYITYKAAGDPKVLGPRFGKDLKKILPEFAKLTGDQIKALKKSGSIKVAGHQFTREEVRVTHVFDPTKTKDKKLDALSHGEMICLLDLVPDQDLIERGTAREVINRVQKLRKKAGCGVEDAIEVFYSTEAKDLSGIIAKHNDSIVSTIRAPVLDMSQRPRHVLNAIRETTEVGGKKLEIEINYSAVAFDEKALKASFKDDALVDGVQLLAVTMEQEKLRKELASKKKLEVVLNGTKMVLEAGKHIFASMSAKMA
eukprot:GFYU01007220.1.p1 GENE.GFYU01007220.1~~GFYU01007220.1.p1  ORF type:complete len:1143 (+),score=481.12 GFYU01007220.1:42-3470(+)